MHNVFTTYRLCDVYLHLIHGSLGPDESDPPTTSDAVHVDQFNHFLQGSWSRPDEQYTETHTQTDHAARSVAIDRIYAMRATRPCSDGNGIIAIYQLSL